MTRGAKSGSGKVRKKEGTSGRRSTWPVVPDAGSRAGELSQNVLAGFSSTGVGWTDTEVVVG